MQIILVRGSGDVGSAVAHRLFSERHQVILQDDAAPAYTRRGMAFTDVFFDGKAELEQVIAKRSALGDHVRTMLACGRAIPALIGAWRDVVSALQPTVIIDARMKKRTTPETIRGAAPLTIGLGPNFIATENVDIVIETSWDAPGHIIKQGPSLPLQGEPKPLGGVGRERYVYAPIAGSFVTNFKIGDHVEASERIATLAGEPILAPLSGRLRGLTHSGVEVAPGTKIIEIDPREPDAVLFGLGERPAKIADSIVSVLTDFH